MANKGGTITLKELITKEALYWGETYEKEVNKAIVKNEQFVNSLKELSGIYSQIKGTKTESSYIATKEKEVKVIKQMSVEYKEWQRQINALEREKVRLQNTLNGEGKVIQKIRIEQQFLNKLDKESAKLTSGLVGAYDKLNVKRTQAERHLKNIIARGKQATQTQKQYDAELRKAQGVFDGYNAKILKADHATKNFTRNVGNYKSAFRGALPALRQFTSALGLIGGVYMFIRVFGDAIKRIRAFDKAMVDLASILQVNRKELSGISDEIQRIASTSIRTTSEVADLATKLATLGKSKEAIEKLLKPVNDLSIGLQASADEAGELLITTLNAYGAGEDEAQHYADVIANMRVSTALDFQRIKDAMSYVAPVAKTSGKSFEELGASIGVLVNNGEKAEKAGRLLRTSILRLAKSGKTLEDGLDAINEAQAKGIEGTKLLALAGDLFGKQSASLGIILANNRDKVAELTEKFKEQKGVLDKLVNDQLESLNNKLKLLDSAWEALIISVENGDGSLSKAFKKATESATNFLNALTEVNKVTKIIGGRDSKWYENLLPGVGAGIAMYNRAGELGKAVKIMQDLDDDYSDLLKKSSSEVAEAIEYYSAYEVKINDKNEKMLVANQLERLHALLIKKVNDELKTNTKDTEDNNKETAKTIEYYKKLITKENEFIQTKATTRAEVLKSQKAIQSYQKEIDKLLGKQNKAEKEQIKNIRLLKLGTEEWFDSMINLLRKQQRETAQGTEEWQEYEKKINKVKKALEDLKGIGEIDPIPDDIFHKFDRFKDALSDLEIKDLEKEAWQERIDIATQAIDEIGSVISTMYDARISKIQEEMQANEDYYSHAMTLANEDSEQQNMLEEERFAIQEKLRKKELAERKKQAQYEKAFSVMQIGLNTASAIVEALPNVPLSIAVGTIGAFQLMSAIATPIPQYYKGTKGTTKDEIALIGEKGTELIETPTRTYLSPNKSTLAYLEKGTKVTPHKETLEKLQKYSILKSLEINNQKVQDFSNNVYLEKYYGEIKKEIRQGLKRQTTKIELRQNFEHLVYVMKKLQF